MRVAEASNVLRRSNDAPDVSAPFLYTPILIFGQPVGSIVGSKDFFPKIVDVDDWRLYDELLKRRFVRRGVNVGATVCRKFAF